MKYYYRNMKKGNFKNGVGVRDKRITDHECRYYGCPQEANYGIHMEKVV